MNKKPTDMFGSKRSKRAEKIHHPVLGDLLPADGEWWETTLAINGAPVGFKIGGLEPDAVLLEHACDIVRSFTQFEKMIVTFLANEASRLPGAADEIHQLVIEDVMLCWPERPDDGMIFFHGPDQSRCWRCDYVGRKPRGLGFDS
jgi:hypothetical protein